MCEDCGNPAHSLKAELAEVIRQRNAEVKCVNAIGRLNERLVRENKELRLRLAAS